LRTPIAAMMTTHQIAQHPFKEFHDLLLCR
jgi:hypothetical protein